MARLFLEVLQHEREKKFTNETGELEVLQH